MSGKRRYRCPECHASEGLWESIEKVVVGWRDLDEHLEIRAECSSFDFETQDGPWANGEVGCSLCGWRGVRADFEALGIDGEALPVIHPNQMTLEAS